MHARQHLDLGGQGADLAGGAPVHADLVAQGARADRGLLQGAERGLEVLLALGEAIGERGQHLLLDGVDGAVAGELALGEQGLGQFAAHALLDGGVLLVGVVQEQRELGGLLRGLRGDLELGPAQGLDEGLGGLEAVGDDLLGGGGGPRLDELPLVLAAAGLDHHDGDVLGAVVLGDDAPGDDDVEDGALQLAPAREGDPLAVDEGQAGAADGAREGQARDLGGHGGGVDGQDVVGVVRVDGEHGLDDLDLVAQALDEAGAQGAVDEAGGQDGLGARAALAAEEGAGDAPGGVGPLLDVDREGEEVELVLGVLADRRGRQDGGGVVEVGQRGACGLPGEAARLESDGALAEAAVVDDSFGCDDVRAFHHGAFLLGSLVSRSTSAFDRSPRSHRGFREPLSKTVSLRAGWRAPFDRARDRRARPGTRKRPDSLGSRAGAGQRRRPRRSMSER